MTIHEAREYCRKTKTLLRLGKDDSVYFDTEDEVAFEMESPSSFRSIGFLSRDLALSTGDGGLLWLHITYGAQGVVEAGKKIIEDLRHARGDSRSLDVAPAQYFDPGEELDLQIALTQVIGNGWNGYFIPASANFALSFRSSHRFTCYSDGKSTHNKLVALLKDWSPREVNN